MFFLFFVFCFQFKYLLASFLSNRDHTGASKKFLPSPPLPLLWSRFNYQTKLSIIMGLHLFVVDVIASTR